MSTPYTKEEWDLDPSEGRWNSTRVRLTVEALFKRVAELEAGQPSAKPPEDRLRGTPTLDDVKRCGA